MDDHRFPADRVQRDGAADDGTGFGRKRQQPPAAAPHRSQQPRRQPCNRGATAPPTTMDQVVDRAIVREHALITFCRRVLRWLRPICRT